MTWWRSSPGSPSRRPALAAAAVAVLLAGLGAGLGARASRVTFRTDDGVTIAATWYEPSAHPAPAVILVHMLNRNRRDWEAVAQRLASAGIGALAIDLRGHGESSPGPQAGDTVDYSLMKQDIIAARRFLASHRDVQAGRIGAAGASLGGSVAAVAAVDGGLASLAILSPALDYRGLRMDGPLRKYTKPVLFVVSDDDAYARRSSADLQKGGPGREVLTLGGAGHGTNMLVRAPELSQTLVEWFRRTIQ